MKETLPSSQMEPFGKNGTGDSQPPRNMIEVRKAIRIMLAYSARKNSANAMPEYSTWKPATISDSPSAMSNGARLVSATPEIRYTRNIGNSGSRYQFSMPKRPCWPFTISPRFMLCEAISTHTSANPIAISYDTICAAERTAPRNAYFELDAQPAMMMPYTPSEVIAKIYNRPALRLDSTIPSVNGTTAHAASDGASAMIGARTNRNLLEPLGTMISLKNNFTPSAIGCSSPKYPTRFGPMRICM